VELAAAVTEPVLLAWNGGPAGFEVRLSQRQATAKVRFALELEDGGGKEWAVRADDLPASPRAGRDWVPPATRLAPLPGGLPFGYHRLTVALPRTEPRHATVISAPDTAWAPGDVRAWGVFMPLYALRTRRSLGVGDLTDLQTMMDWVRGLGGTTVATLPLLAAFLGEAAEQPFEPSPYAPASRLFWNELYLDVERIPELAGSEGARALLRDDEIRRQAARLRRARLVDYRVAMDLKRRILSALAETLFSSGGGGGGRRAAFEAFSARRPDTLEYARFRAVTEARGVGWPAWPGRMQRGALSARAADPAVVRYHRYVQFVADQQFAELGKLARGEGAGLYLDLPLGVHRDGYDVWREQDLFATEANGGAPPDRFFTGGQDWGFPPLHPDRSREQGHRYIRSCLRHLFSNAGVVRVDHVMWLHRLFWIPKGFDARQGVYVRYPSEELKALLCLESHRAGAMVVGEDLGTVPGYVRRAMARHHLHGSYVAQYEARPDPGRALRPPRSTAVASVNTHDMPPFAAYWEGLDIETREELSLLDPEQATEERRNRERVRRALVRFLRREGLLARSTPGTREVLDGLLAYLAGGTFPVAIATLEDLWLEREPQNMPGTWNERPNWRRKARWSLEDFTRDQSIRESLLLMDRLRRADAPAGRTAT